MKQVLILNGKAVVEEVPEPQAEPGSVLVAVRHSCISPGTESSGMKESGEPLWKRALKNPAKVKKVVQMIASSGVSHTKSVVQGKLSSGYATGYSAAGEVIAVGAGIDDIKVGDLVACAGAQCAHHAEAILAPRNLCALIPAGMDTKPAAAVALGAIAMQGVRRAKPTLGECFAVIGLGVLGQLTAQMLKVNGCRVIGSDLDPSRAALALELGMDFSLSREAGDPVENVWRMTGGMGVDGVIITASGASSEIVSMAFAMCRRKGRVVLVGDVGLELKRADFYNKEIDFLISTSYGPGRYDSSYEEYGLDYPPAYVRWTENRNMSEYLKLTAEGRLNVERLISAVYPIDEAGSAYESLTGENRPMITILSYPGIDGSKAGWGRTENQYALPGGAGRIGVAVVGAGGFAKGMHLPNLKLLENSYCIKAIVSRTGHNANATAKQFGANYATTDYAQVLADPEVDAVLICTRHDTHASMTLAALKAGKHVLVEKPTAVTRDELEAIVNFYKDAGTGGNGGNSVNSGKAGEKGRAKPVLLTGFNRRFSRYALRIKEITEGRKAPMILNYRMNAGYIPLDSWLHSAEGGGRNIGEACHIYDLFTYLTGAQVSSVKAHSINAKQGYYSARDNFCAVIKFDDGSVANLTYTALGSKEYPKERLEVFCDGKVIFMDDYKKLEIIGAKTKGVETPMADKGHREELEEFARVISKGGDWPISLQQQAQAMNIAFDVEDTLDGSL